MLAITVGYCSWLQLPTSFTFQGRCKHHFIPKIYVWLNRNHGEVNYYLTQKLSGHDDSPESSSCRGVLEEAEHVFFVCPRYTKKLEIILEQTIEPAGLMDAKLSSETAWNAESNFVTELLLDLRSIERRRSENKNDGR